MELAHDSPETMTHVSRKEPIICLSLNIVKLGLGRDCVVFKSHRQLCVWVASKQTPHEEVTHTNMATSPLKERFPLQGKQNLGNNGCKLAAIHSPGDRAKATGYPWSVGVLDPMLAQTCCRGHSSQESHPDTGQWNHTAGAQGLQLEGGMGNANSRTGAELGQAPQGPTAPSSACSRNMGTMGPGHSRGGPSTTALLSQSRGPRTGCVHRSCSTGCRHSESHRNETQPMDHSNPKHNIYIKSFPKHQHCKTKLHTINCY